MPSPNRARVGVPLLVAAVAAMASVVLLIVMLGSDRLVETGLTGYVWYVLLLLLGLSAAVTAFSLFKSYARYSGEVLNGKLELGGPVVVMLAVVVLGFTLVPAPRERFDVTIFLHGEAGRQAVVLRNEGRLSLDLGADRRTEAVGVKGEVRFINIPADMRGEKVPVALESQIYELADPTLELKLDQGVFYAAVKAKELRLAGVVEDDRDQPLKGAQVDIAGQRAVTDGNGRFELGVPADLPESDRTASISAPGYATWRSQVAPGGGPLQVRLVAAPAQK